jgi:hypothetical protein
MRFITLKEDGMEMIIEDGKAVQQFTFFILKGCGMEIIENDTAGASIAPEEEQV